MKKYTGERRTMSLHRVGFVSIVESFSLGFESTQIKIMMTNTELY